MVAPMRCYAHTVPTFTATSDSSPLHTTFTLRSHGATFTLYPRSPRLLHHSSRGLPIDLVGKLWTRCFLFFSFPAQGPERGGLPGGESGRLRVVHKGLLGQDRGALAPSLQAPRRNGGPSARPRRQAPLGMGEARVCSRSAYHSGARGMLARGVQRIATSRRVWRMGGCVFALADACGVCSVTKTFRRLCSIASSRRSRSTPRTRYPTLFSRSTRQT